MHGLVCAVKHVVTKQVSRGHVYVQSCVISLSLSHSFLTGSCLVIDHLLNHTTIHIQYCKYDHQVNFP